MASGDWNIQLGLSLEVQKKVAKIPFRQHALHDIEPIFWTTIWSLFKFVVPGADEVGEKKHAAYCELFLPTAFDTVRQVKWSTPLSVQKALRNGLPKLYVDLLENDSILGWQNSFLLNQLDAYSASKFASWEDLNSKVMESRHRAIEISKNALSQLRAAIAQKLELQAGFLSINGLPLL